MFIIGGKEFIIRRGEEIGGVYEDKTVVKKKYCQKFWIIFIHIYVDIRSAHWFI